MLPEADGLRRTRKIVAFGLLAYLASFFFLSSSHQKTIFYLLVAAPSLFLLLDFRQVCREYRTPLSLFLVFLTYFSLSALWSDNGSLLNGLKIALCVISLMLAVHSTMNLRADSAAQIIYFILIVGSCAACLYCFMIVIQIVAATDYSTIWSQRYSLRILSGWGDSNPINTAIYFSVVTLAAWWCFPQKNLLAKSGLLLLIGACMILIFLTQSRGPFLSLIIVLSLISLMRRQRDDLILWLIALTTGVVAVLYFNLVPLIVDRAGSPNYRIEIWLKSIEIVKENLFFGQGLGDSAAINISIENVDIATVTHSHSSILETFRVGGLIGGLLFLVMVISITCQSLRKMRGRCFFVYWLVLGVLCLSTNGRLPLIRPSIEWFAFWMPLFLIFFTPAGHQPPEFVVEKKGTMSFRVETGGGG
jgi:hypothetical protein